MMSCASITRRRAPSTSCASTRRQASRHLNGVTPTSRWHPADLSAVSSSTFATALLLDGRVRRLTWQALRLPRACTTAIPSSSYSTSSTRSIRRAAATSLWITSLRTILRRSTRWFDEHPRWTRQPTPKHASWLNQIECWFSILARHILRRGSFTSTDELAAKIDAYVAWYLETDRPFCWSYRPKSWDESRQTSAARH